MTTAELSYGTTAERAFLDQMAAGPAAPTLLRNYITAADKRIAWGSINKTEVLLYAEMLLGNALAKQAAVDRLLRRVA
ncbi:hypothetical protein K2O51_23125 [Cupriavidus pinatubonensis]|uniref:hypothetical protein n=1 Tax=Cupriavidus pinatubonensis TaxID=248026 RepID=UPI001C72B317|nr:hypothetical protein [Cupriavidus pinatubonensis]QYY30266.1 hypothetical protein K2O51_23125 [Cupriavidus pinatubonensis]